MAKVQKITALLCALVLAVSSLGTYTDHARAAGLPVTSDDAMPSRETTERGAAKANAQKLEFGKKAQGRLVSGDDGQRYQVTLMSSGQLDVHLEGVAGKLAGRLTDKDGKGWSPRRRTDDGKQTYQLKKGTYYYQVQVAKGVQVPETGLDYAVTATFKSAKADFEDNNTRKKAAKLPLKPESFKVFYGHLASNAPTEYYKLTLKRVSYIAISINTQMMDKEPETFVVTLYNEDGKRMLDWENPDWVEYEEDMDGEANWITDDYAYCQGLQTVLDAGSYYVGVSVKRDGDGKVPMSARYGQFAVGVSVDGVGVEPKLSSKQAEYTGKRIAPPKVSVKEYPKDLHYYPVSDLGDYFEKIWNMQTKDNNEVKSMKKIGRYRIGGEMYRPYGLDISNAFAIFTVTPIRGKISRATSKKPGEVQVSVKKNAQSTGYQIQIARDRKFKKSVKTLKTTNARKTIKGLSPGKKYYIRIRNYKDVKTYYCSSYIAVPESIYGKWSKVKTVVCK